MIFKISQMYVFMFLHRFISFYTIYLTILKQNNTAPIFISTIIITHELGKIMADVYSGAAADKYGVRKIMGIGLCIKAVGILFWIISNDLIYCFVGMFLLGIGRSFTVGKIEVYTYNMLFSIGKQKSFQSIWLGMFLLDGLSAALIGWLSGVLYIIGGFRLDLVFSLFIILIIHAPFVLFFMSDPVLIIRKSANDISLHSIMKIGISIIKKDKNIALLVITIGLLQSLFIVLSKFKILVCNDINMQFVNIANIDSMSHLLQVIFAGLFLFFIKFKLSFKANMWLIAFTLFTISISTFLYGIYSILTLIIFAIIYPVIVTSLKNTLESSVTNEIRATISTTASFIMSFFNIIFMLILGIMAQIFSYQISLFIISILGIFIIIVSLFFKTKQFLSV